MLVPKMRVLKQIKVPTVKVINVATDEVNVRKGVISFDGDSNEVGMNVLTQKNVNIFKKAGIEIDYFNRRRLIGKKKMKGLPVRVVPINRQSYRSGAFIGVYESSLISSKNTNLILKLLRANRIDWDTECRLVSEEMCLIKT